MASFLSRAALSAASSRLYRVQSSSYFHKLRVYSTVMMRHIQNPESRIFGKATRSPVALETGLAQARRCFASASGDAEEEADVDGEGGSKASDEKPIDPSKDRRVPIAPEVSLRYVESNAYKEVYGDDPVWKPFRRAFPGRIPPSRTRRTCVRGGVITTGSPCPICRDEYLVVDYRNIKLLKQFLCPYTGEIYPVKTTSVCMTQQQRLHVAISKAIDYGYITTKLPYRKYNYNDYYNFEKNEPRH